MRFELRPDRSAIRTILSVILLCIPGISAAAESGNAVTEVGHVRTVAVKPGGYTELPRVNQLRWGAFAGPVLLRPLAQGIQHFESLALPPGDNLQKRFLIGVNAGIFVEPVPYLHLMFGVQRASLSGAEYTYLQYDRSVLLADVLTYARFRGGKRWQHAGIFGTLQAGFGRFEARLQQRETRQQDADWKDALQEMRGQALTDTFSQSIHARYIAVAPGVALEAIATRNLSFVLDTGWRLQYLPAGSLEADGYASNLRNAPRINISGFFMEISIAFKVPQLARNADR